MSDAVHPRPQREKSKRDLLELQNGIDTFENSSTQMLPQKDPYLSHHIVENQLKKQVHKESESQLLLSSHARSTQLGAT